MTYKERARKALEQLDLGMRKMGVVTTAHYEVGQPILEKAFRDLIKEFENGVCPAVVSVQQAVPDLCDHCKKMIKFALENEE
jgi:hypothetical protein